jgi:glycosyltransferase involved in cell wall biosynthesis
MKKIAHFTPYYAEGGIERYIENIIQHITEYKHEILIEKIKRKYRHDEKINNLIIVGPKSDYLFNRKIIPMKIKYFYNTSLTFIRSNNLCDIITNREYNLIHFHNYNLTPFLLLKNNKIKHLAINQLKRKMTICKQKTPFIFTDHSIFNKFDYYYDHIQFFTEVFDNIICVSKSGYNNLMEYLKKMNLTKNVWYLPNSVDTNLFRPDRPVCDFTRLGYAGRIDPEKGSDYLFPIIERLPKNIEFHIAYYCTMNDELETKLIKFQKNNPNLRLYKSLRYEQMPEFYNKIDILLNTTLPSANDRTIIEGMACGRPVIQLNKGSDDSNYPVIDGVNGFLVHKDAYDIISLISSLTERVSLPRIGENARRLIKEELSNDVIIPKLRVIYDEIQRP